MASPYQCPKCGYPLDFGIHITASATISVDTSTGETAVKIDEDASRMWDDESSMWCKHCNHFGVVADFQTKKGGRA